MRTVTVTADRHEVEYMDRNHEIKTLGEIVIDNYENEGRRILFNAARSNEFIPESKKTKPYTLGFGSQHLDFVNPAGVMEILADRGWEISDQLAFKGGLQMITTFTNPTVTLDDIYDYDHKFWSNFNDSAVAGMRPAIHLETNLVVGKVAVSMLSGFLRMVCTNGLIIKLLGLPTLRFKHSDFSDLNSIRENMDTSGITSIERVVYGPQIGTAKTVHRMADVLHSWIDTIDDPKWAALEASFKSISPNMVKPWALKGYIAGLHEIADMAATSVHQIRNNDQVYLLDLMQAYTNAVNHHRAAQNTDRGAWAALSMANTVVEKTASFSSLVSIFSDN